MTDQTLTHVSAVTTNAVGLFREYCKRNSVHQHELKILQKEFEQHEMSLMFSICISASETIFSCWAVHSEGEPLKLFDVHEMPVGNTH